jgi:heme/copper-type cytochrome/quinol oxidase subunit 2
MDSRWLMGVVMISIGISLFYVARYLLAPENKKKQKAQEIKHVGIVWIVVGALIYLGFVILLFLPKP